MAGMGDEEELDEPPEIQQARPSCPSHPRPAASPAQWLQRWAGRSRGQGLGALAQGDPAVKSGSMARCTAGFSSARPEDQAAALGS